MSFRNAFTPGDAVAITPDDSTAVDLYGLYVGGAGDVAVVTGAGNAVTFPSVPAGSIISLRISIVKTTGTTATNLVGLKA